MTVSDQTAAGVDWNFERKLATFLIAHLRQRRRAAFYEIDALARFGQPENFISDDLRD